MKKLAAKREWEQGGTFSNGDGDRTRGLTTELQINVLCIIWGHGKAPLALVKIFPIRFLTLAHPK